MRSEHSRVAFAALDKLIDSHYITNVTAEKEVHMYMSNSSMIKVVWFSPSKDMYLSRTFTDRAEAQAFFSVLKEEGLNPKYARQ